MKVLRTKYLLLIPFPLHKYWGRSHFMKIICRVNFDAEIPYVLKRFDLAVALARNFHYSRIFLSRVMLIFFLRLRNLFYVCELGLPNAFFNKSNAEKTMVKASFEFVDMGHNLFRFVILFFAKHVAVDLEVWLENSPIWSSILLIFFSFSHIKLEFRLRKWVLKYFLIIGWIYFSFI